MTAYNGILKDIKNTYNNTKNEAPPAERMEKMDINIKNKQKALVLSSDELIPGTLYSLTLRAPDIAPLTLPGQLVHIAVGGEDSAFSLRRPFSVAYTDGDVLCVRYNVVGEGTRWLSGVRAGDVLDLLGPVGNGWDVSGTDKILLCGGGTGIYSLLGASKRLGARAKALLGFRSSPLVNSTGDFERFGSAVSVITDDGTSGRKGFVTELLENEIKNGGWDRVFICGPHNMMKNAAETAMKAGLTVYVSLEEHMGCGIGACMACVCKMVRGDGGEEYRRVCVDGPVFNASEVIW